MVFSSIPFLYYFLAAVLLLYFIAPASLKNTVLLVVSLVFYGYGEPKYLLLIGAAVVLAYFFGLGIRRSKLCFYLSVATSLGMLCWFKYADFFVESFNRVFGADVAVMGIALPIGISFYTFQILSYTIDVYRGRIEPQRNFIRFAMYVTMFPQLIAGPIVVYAEVESQLDVRARTVSAETLWTGSCRFITGLAKKVLLANSLGELCKLFGESGGAEQSVLFYWLYAVSFTLQIYFDFSGYSDMAIGLGKIFGFSFPENFNYPYVARSMTAFWRRWHMTLGRWFREYVYIPLGGSRVSRGRWVFNLFVVWSLTGLWHGAAWTFVVWGLLHGLLLLVERLGLGELLSRAPAWLAHAYVLLAVLLTMVVFNAESLGVAVRQIGGLFGAGGLPLASPISLYYLRSYGMLLAVSMAGCTPVVRQAAEKLAERFPGGVWTVVETLMPLVLLLLVTAYLVDGSYNPFLYFRF